ncbi:MAG: hypothetical protein ACU4F9_07550 [Arcticibacter sp.]
MKHSLLIIAVFVGLLFTSSGCGKFYFRSEYKNANELLHDSKLLSSKPFLKAHFKNGNVCVLYDTWQITNEGNVVQGNGTLYDFNRRRMFDGKYSIPVDSVAIFESNVKIENPEASRVAALTVLTGIDGVLGLICLSNPKACFGSCPTFYVNPNDQFHYSDAEGFSSAISPIMEYGDIDALRVTSSREPSFTLTMKNEALETHCIKDIKLLAYPIQTGQSVYQTNHDAFMLCGKAYKPLKASGEEGDVTELLSADDRVERFSLTDPNNLGAKEEVLISFDQLDDTKTYGLLIDFRQTLLTTYLIYNAIGYMGDNVGDFFARIERGENVQQKLKVGLMKELGEIEVHVRDDKVADYVYQGGLFETGPIAINRQIVPFKMQPSQSNMKIKLVMNKGLWRIDCTRLVELQSEVQPITINPGKILKQDSTGVMQLNADDRLGQHLVSLPGDLYKWEFDMPDPSQDYQLFLYSKGYYLEWMRSSWLEDKNLLQLRKMIENPAAYLKDQAHNYKQYEHLMEHEFWSSRIDTKSISKNGIR